MEMVSQKRSITPEKAVALLKKQGLEINPTEAELVVNLLYFLAEIVTDENTEYESSRSIYQSKYWRTGG